MENEIKTLPPDVEGRYHYAVLFMAPKSVKWKELKALLETRVETREAGENFVALFKPNLADFEVLATVLRVAGQWGGTTFFHAGRPIPATRIWKPADCINELKELAGTPAACLRKDIDYWGNDGPRHFVVPCKELHVNWREIVGDDYKAHFLISAREKGIDTCPFFRPESFSGPHAEERKERRATIIMGDEEDAAPGSPLGKRDPDGSSGNDAAPPSSGRPSLLRRVLSGVLWTVAVLLGALCAADLLIAEGQHGFGVACGVLALGCALAARKAGKKA